MKNAVVLIAAGSIVLSAIAQSQRVYFGTGKGKGIYFAELDLKAGTLSPPQLAAEVVRPGFLVIHPNRRFLYSTCSGQDLGKKGGVAAFEINRDGTLTRLNVRSSKGQGPSHVSVDATGQCLMVSYYGSGGVASFQIREDGSLSEARSEHQHAGSGAHPKRQQGPRAHSIYPNPENTHAYSPDLGIDKVMIYRLDPGAGTLTDPSFAEVPGGSMGPRHMKWSAEGAYAYVLNELDLSVSVFKPGASPGALEFLTTVSTLPEGADPEGMTCSEIRIHPNGKFIYAANRDVKREGRDSLTVFSSFAHTEGFRRLATVPAEVSVPRNFNIDPSGQWILVGGLRSNDIAIFKVDSKTGQLAFTGTKVPFEGTPICIEFLD
ncbi:MAG: lactonase family protein [Pontiella sp.]|nr:lactonase family protein [Pontiella sp.]